MLSVASVRSASGAAEYFAKDDYYTAEHSSEATLWSGQGAAELGLSGEVDKAHFEGVLNGVLPDGEKVGQVANRRAGMDLTFSVPKSVSIMAYVAGDKRLLDANIRAVQATMSWAEKHLAEGRRDIDGRKVPVRTGNLVYALFQHDTSRSLDPQAHIHAVIANLTRMPDGRMQALHNGRLWSENTTLGSIYHAQLRSEIEQLGYVPTAPGKHGTFEIVGVPKSAIAEFSQRRQDIIAKAEALDLRGPKALNAVAVRTRDAKLELEDRDALRRDWRERAESIGFKGDELRQLAEARTQYEALSPVARGYRALSAALDAARAFAALSLRPHDPLVDRMLHRMAVSPAEARAQFATASAIRILSEREAAFSTNTVVKTALDLGMRGVTADLIGARLDKLVSNGQLIAERSRRHDGAIDFVTTREALRTEQHILDLVAQGQGRAEPLLPAVGAFARAQEVAQQPLNSGQLAAATAILGSSDRTVLVQGVAGGGKSTMLHAVARVAEAEGYRVLGLAFQNKMVGDLAKGAGVEARTLASFLATTERALDGSTTLDREALGAEFARTVLLVDETSMISSTDMERLLTVSEKLGVARLALVGDRQQLSSIEAGKAFALIQANSGTTVRMDENMRQRTDQLRTVAKLANQGRTSAALATLGADVVEAPDPAAAAADRWLGLSPEDRERTLILASGRDAREAINSRVQAGLLAKGILTGDGLRLDVESRNGVTREELRLPSTYRPGQIIDVRSRNNDLGLERGRARVERVLPSGKVVVSNGRTHRFDPQRLPIGGRDDAMQLLERKTLSIYEGERIRWTANDRERGLSNAALASVSAIEGERIIVQTDDGNRLSLEPGDPMRRQLDLAYSLNMHMAQGVTADRAIMVMNSEERHLTNQRLFNVGVSRVRDALTLVVDDKDRVEKQLARNAGDTTSAIEMTEARRGDAGHALENGRREGPAGRGENAGQHLTNEGLLDQRQETPTDRGADLGLPVRGLPGKELGLEL